MVKRAAEVPQSNEFWVRVHLETKEPKLESSLTFGTCTAQTKRHMLGLFLHFSSYMNIYSPLVWVVLLGDALPEIYTNMTLFH